MLELVGLTAHADRRVRGFSKGMLQRIGLAQALVHEPELVFLDEPTSGLDPMGRRMVRDILNAERQRGATVFLNSHLLGEVEITCDRVVFIRAGAVVAAQNLRDAAPLDVRVVAHVRGMSDAAMEELRRGTTEAQLEAERLVFSVRTREEIPGIVRALVAQGVELFDLSPERIPLEELFVKIMGEDGGL
jgi:ABC-2 type transport system ATP-binding protein